VKNNADRQGSGAEKREKSAFWEAFGRDWLLTLF
jgi:hypothetical protein